MLTFLLLLYVGLGVAQAVAYRNVVRRFASDKLIKLAVRTQVFAFNIGVSSYIDLLKECSVIYKGSLGDVEFSLDKYIWIIYRLNYVFLPLSIVLAIVCAPIAYLAKAVYHLKRRKRLAA